MPDKYLYRDPTTGRTRERELAGTGGTPAQSGQAAALDANGRFPMSVMPADLGDELVSSGTAATALTQGNFVTQTPSGWVRASAGVGGDTADGWVDKSYTIGASDVKVLTGDKPNSYLTNLTVGSRYYLSADSPGGITKDPVSGAGKIHQYLGKASSTGTLMVNLGEGIVLA